VQLDTQITSLLHAVSSVTYSQLGANFEQSGSCVLVEILLFFLVVLILLFQLGYTHLSLYVHI
jgi:hypothetical protein